MGLRIAITEKDREIRRLSFDSHDITVGRAEDNDVCLPRGSVSKRHTRIAVDDGKVFVLDLSSTNGTFVNGKRVLVPQTVSPSDAIAIGEFVLGVEQIRGGAEKRETPRPPTPPPSTPAPDPVREHARTQRIVHEKLIEAMDLRRLDLDALGRAEL
ncbi:MAG: FHA domain-containing protein, partial [Myxococcales bacterium]